MAAEAMYGKFAWDTDKERNNLQKHGLNFREAIDAFLDPFRVIAVDELHSAEEERFFCIGRVGDRVATIRFTMRG